MRERLGALLADDGGGTAQARLAADPGRVGLESLLAEGKYPASAVDQVEGVRIARKGHRRRRELSMIRGRPKPKTAAAHIALVLPAVILLAVCLIGPIGLFLLRSVENAEIPGTLPRTVAALQSWDGHGLPDDSAFAALVDEMRGAAQTDAIGILSRRLNFAVAGYRALVMKTANALVGASAGDARAQLTAIDRRWGAPEVWTVLRQQSGPYTDFYYLAATDMRRGADGAITRLPDGDRLFIGLFARTLAISATVTLLCLVIGYPAAHLLATASPRMLPLLLTLVMLPFWTPLLVRTTAWIVLLQTEGLVNRILRASGVIDGPLPLFGNRFAVILSMTQVLLPYMILPLYAAMRKVPPELLRAAGSLGANPWRGFRRVYLPQTAPGIVAGMLFVFILALGYYITPLLVGGPGDQMISYFIALYTNESLNWGLASALGTLLLALACLVYAGVSRFGRGVAAAMP